MTRTFESSDAVRKRVPLMIGIVSPSGAGKTYSALRLATGIQRVTGGAIALLDTENGRGLHYADRFKYKYTPFAPPFGPLDYLAGIEHCYKNDGALTIIVDSCTHEHEGPGGVLEQHDAECTRLMKEWDQPRDKVQLGAWTKPKQDRTRLIQTMLQIPVNFVLCFRAKEKLKIEKGKPPVNQGWMPIGAAEWLFEMTMNCLLYPNAGGVPMWEPKEPGEESMLKLPAQFRSTMLERFAGQPLSEDIGQALAEWAAGDTLKRPTDDDCSAGLLAAKTAKTPEELAGVIQSFKGKAWSDEQRKRLAAAVDKRTKELQPSKPEASA